MKSQKRKEFPVTFDGRITPSLKDKLRLKYPSLNSTEVRRYRIPLHEALLAELSEGEFRHASKFFNEIIQYDLDHEQNLVNDKNVLELIYNELTRSETTEKQIETLLELAKKIWEMKILKLCWVADRIFSRACELITNYQLEGTQVDAVAKYFYGKFLNEFDDRLQESVVLLEKVYDISNGADDLGIEMEKLFSLVLPELATSLIKLSVQERSKNPEKAIKLAEKSVKVVRKIRNKDEAGILEIKAEIEIGNCLMSKALFSKALLHFELASELAKVRNLNEIGLKALIKMSECVKNDEANYEEFLRNAMSFSKLHSLIDSTAEILVMLGRFGVTQKDCTKALDYFNEASTIYKKMDSYKQLQKVRLLMAPLRAQTIFNDLVDEILKSDKGALGMNIHLSRLLLWCDRKNPIRNKHHEYYQESDEDVDIFITKYYDPDEITKVA